MAKYTLKQLEALLKEMGHADPVELVDDETQAVQGFSPESILNPFVEARKPFYMQEFQTNVLPQKLSEQAGMLGSKLRANLRRLSAGKLQTRDLEGLSDEDALAKFNEVMATTSQEGAAALRTQMQELIAANDAAVNELKTQHQAELGNVQKKFTDREIAEYLESVVKDMPLPKIKEGEDGTKAIKMRAAALKRALEDEYGTHWDPDKRALDLRKKDNPEMPVLDGQTVITPKNFGETYFKNLGMWQEDTRNLNANEVNRQQQPYQPGGQQGFPPAGGQQQGSQLPSDIQDAINAINSAG